MTTKRKIEVLKLVRKKLNDNLKDENVLFLCIIVQYLTDYGQITEAEETWFEKTIKKNTPQGREGHYAYWGAFEIIPRRKLIAKLIKMEKENAKTKN